MLRAKGSLTDWLVARGNRLEEEASRVLQVSTLFGESPVEDLTQFLFSFEQLLKFL